MMIGYLIIINNILLNNNHLGLQPFFSPVLFCFKMNFTIFSLTSLFNNYHWRWEIFFHHHHHLSSILLMFFFLLTLFWSYDHSFWSKSYIKYVCIKIFIEIKKKKLLRRFVSSFSFSFTDHHHHHQQQHHRHDDDDYGCGKIFFLNKVMMRELVL